MKLGDKLKATLTELEQAGIKTLKGQSSADMEKIRIQRVNDTFFIENIQNDLVRSIERGKVPAVAIRNYNDQAWIREVSNGKGRNLDLWSDMRRFFSKEGLNLKAIEEYDINDQLTWINITVTLLPERPRGFAGI